ncbi:MAG: hypothetical protein WCC63_06955, partial [Candidatus Bathyarchaeia archaeon]
MYNEYELRSNRFSLITVAVIAVVVVAGILGNIYTYQLFSGRVEQLENRIATLRVQNSALTDALGSYNQTVMDNVSLSELYESVIDSVVLIRGYVVETGVFEDEIAEASGSGFVYNVSGQM